MKWLLGAIALVMVLSGTATAQAAGSGVILKPKAGGIVQAKPLQVKLRVGKAGVQRVTLNRTVITREFKGEKGAVRKVVAGASHGLRHGSNRLRVVLRAGGRRKVGTVRFRVVGRRPIAGAGRDRHLTVGHISLLNGLRSRAHRRGGRGLHFSWKVVRAPQGSDLRHRLFPGAAMADVSRPRARFRPQAKPRPRLLADAPGVYAFRLKVRDRNGLTGTDRVRITVDPLPAVQIDTMATEGEKDAPGIRVGDQFYPGARDWAQIVVIDLSNLELKLNKSYDCPAATGLKADDDNKVAGCLAQVDKDIRPFYKQSKRFAIIATNHPPAERTVADTPAWNTQPPVGLDKALTLFNVNTSRWSPKHGTIRRGRISVIDLTPGGGNFRDVRRVYRGFKYLDSVNRIGRITGRLAVGPDGLYGYQPTDPIRVDTQPARGSVAGQSRISVGDKAFTLPTSGARGGFHILALDADDPTREFDGQQAFFATGSAGFDPVTENTMRTRLEAMLAFLRRQAQRDDRIVIVATRGNPAMKLTAGSPQADDVNNIIFEIVNELERLGATRNAVMPVFYSHLKYGGHSYALIGGGGRGIDGQVRRDRGTEISSDEVAGVGAPSKVRVGFDLSRVYNDNEYGILNDTLPGEASELGAKLTELINDPSSQWPEAGNSARTAAIRQIGRDVFSTPSPRTRYWTVPYSFETWTSDQKAIEKYCDKAKPADGTNAAALEWACGELSDEIDWLTTINGRMRAIALPFRSQSVSSWAELAAVTNDIRTQVGLGESDAARKTRSDVKLGLEMSLNVASKLPEVGEAFEAIQFLYEIASSAVEMGVTENDDEGEFESTVGQTGKDLVRRMNAFQAMIDSQMPDELVSDYRKLRTAGLCLAGRKECSSAYGEDPGDWQITKKQLDGAAEAFPYGMRATAYGALLPARYTLWRIRDARYDTGQPVETERWLHGPTIGQPCPADTFKQSAVGSVVALGTFYPFAEAVPQGYLDRRVYVDAPRNRSGQWLHGRTNLWDDLGLGYITGGGVVGNLYEMHVPTEKALSPLFDEVDPANLAAGGLGADPETFYMRSFNPVPLGGKGGEGTTFPQKYPFRDNHMGYDETLCHTGN